MSAQAQYDRKAREVQLLDTPTSALQDRYKEGCFGTVVAGACVAGGLAGIVLETYWPGDEKSSVLVPCTLVMAMNTRGFIDGIRTMWHTRTQLSQQASLRERAVQVRRELGESESSLELLQHQVQVSEYIPDDLAGIVADYCVSPPGGEREAGDEPLRGASSPT